MIATSTEPYTPTQIKAILHPLLNRWFFGKIRKFSQLLNAIFTSASVIICCSHLNRNEWVGDSK